MNLPDIKLPSVDPKILPYILAGGAGALVGGGLTAMGRRRANESRWQRRLRVLRNALLLGGAGAGAAGLIQRGVRDTITEPLPKDDVDPLRKSVHDLAAGPAGVGAAAAGGTYGLAKVRAGERHRAATSLLDNVPDNRGKNFANPVDTLHTELLARGPDHATITRGLNRPDTAGDVMRRIRATGIDYPGILRTQGMPMPGTGRPVTRMDSMLNKGRMLGEAVLGTNAGRGRVGPAIAKRLGIGGLAVGAPLLLAALTKGGEQ